MLLSVGDRLGPYEILALIGKGGMGEVYRARDPRLNRDVAIKVSAAQFTERFEREAKAIAALNHPNICQIYDVGTNYLVMEYIEGSPLKGPLPLDQAMKYAAQICAALDAAHRKGITHRDLKPTNILVTKSGIKLLDFGLAKLTFAKSGTSDIGQAPKPDDATFTMALTGKNEIVGTLYYMSPEQLQEQASGQQIDGRSDIFSFGLVLYEMITGKRAFDGGSAASVIAAIMERPAPSIADVAPPALDRVLKKCLAKDPDERWQTARDLRDELDWVMLPRTETEPANTASVRLRPRYMGWVGAAILVLSVVVGWESAQFFRSPAERQVIRLQLNPPAGGQFIFGLGITPGGIAISPDGKTVAFVASVASQAGLWVQSLDGAEARLLSGSEGAGYPFWSPDGKSIAFFANGKLQRIDLPGGAPLTISEIDASLRPGGAWSDDGYILFGTTSGLLRVSASGGTPSPLSNHSSPARMPQMLPGGRFLYFADGSASESAGIYAGSFDKPNESVRLLATATTGLYAPGGAGKHYVLWLRGSVLLVQELDLRTLKLTGEPHPIADPVGSLGGALNATVSSNGLLVYGTSNVLSQFRWFDRTGKALGNVGEPGEYNSFRLSADGRRAVLSRNHPKGSDLWLLDTERGVLNRFTSNVGTATYPVWSSDGSEIVFGTGNPLSLFRKPSTGVGGEERLTQSTSLHLPTDWSRDSRLLYFDVGPNTQEDIWTVAVTPSGKRIAGVDPKPYIQTPFRELNARFSPQPIPRWVAYVSNKSGQFEVYIDSFPELGHEVRISTEGGMYPEWSDTGNELFYLSPDYRLVSVGLKASSTPLDPSTPRALFQLPSDVSTWSPYQAGPGGQRFLVRAIPEQKASQPLTVIVNWPALLENKTQ